MNKFHNLAVLAIVLFFASVLAVQSADNKELLKQAKESLQAVEALNSATVAGVTRSDYIRRKADTQVAVDKFVNEYGSKNQFAVWLLTAMKYHSRADTVWGEYFSCKEASNDFIPVSDSVIAYIISSYPDLKKYVTTFITGDELYYPGALSYFWNLADGATTKARKVYESYTK